MRRLQGDFCRLVVALALFGAAVADSFADTVRVGGTGSGSSLFRALTPALAKLQPGDQITILMPPLGSKGGLRALRSDAIDVAVIAQMPPAEDAKLIESRRIGRSPVVLASIDGLRRQGFSRAEIPALFGTRPVFWDDGRPIRTILRSAHETDTMMLKTLSPEIARSIDQALARPGATVAEHDLDALAWLEKVPGTIGVTTLGLLVTEKSRLQPYPIDGVVPSNEALARGSYRLAKDVRLAWKRPASPAVERLLAALQSPAGKKLLRDFGYLPEQQ